MTTDTADPVTPVPSERPDATLALPSAIGYGVAALAMAMVVVQVVTLIATGESLITALVEYELHNVAVTAVLGALILRRRPGHVIGWVLVAVGGLDVVWRLGWLYRQVTGLELDSDPVGSLWVPMLGGLLIALPLLFPDGRLLSRRWRPVAWYAVVTTALMTIGIARDPGGTGGTVLLTVAEPLWLSAMLIGLVPMVLRFRRSRATQRQQFKWAFYGLAVSVPLAAMSGIPTSAMNTVGGEAVRAPIILLAMVVIPGTIAVAVLRYRLYDIDIVINKTVVFVALAAFITAVYAGVVVGLGRLLPIADGDLGLSIAATALVAVAFEPVRRRVQHAANKLVYGDRATPYEALAAMTATLGRAADQATALTDAARLLAEGTGAAHATVWLARGGYLVPVGTSGDGERPDRVRLVAPSTGDAATPSATEPRPSRGDATTPNAVDLPELPDADLTEPVRYEGRLVGALSLTKRPGEGVNTADRKLVRELAGQATLLLANTRLRTRLRDRLDELRASRQRLLAAQDRAHHTLERDLHDGAQQEVVACKIKIGLARTVAAREGATELADRLAGAATVADQAVDALREVARGIYPPLLEAEGIAAALGAQARRPDIAVTVLDRGTGRYSREIEAGAYFCAVEAIGNAARHARASHVHVQLDGTDTTLTLTAIDDGVGFDPDVTPRGSGLTHMTDRAEAADGTLTVASLPGHGTTVTLVLPTSAPAPTTATSAGAEPAAVAATPGVGVVDTLDPSDPVVGRSSP